VRCSPDVNRPRAVATLLERDDQDVKLDCCGKGGQAIKFEGGRAASISLISATRVVHACRMLCMLVADDAPVSLCGDGRYQACTGGQ
jgi:predicted nuclease with RNAse H fold